MQHWWALSGSSLLTAVLFKGCLVMLCSGSRFLSPAFHHKAGGRREGGKGQQLKSKALNTMSGLINKTVTKLLLFQNIHWWGRREGERGPQ